MNIKRFIVITSIFEPTEAVKRFAQLRDWQVLVVGDKKTPKSWNFKNVTYLSPKKQQDLEYEVTSGLPWNHYCRKNIGYLHAVRKGAEVIVDTDDDNIPKGSWDIFPLEGYFKTIVGSGFVNTYQYFTDEFIWPRGFPLNYILREGRFSETRKDNKVGIWQSLADENPDVDAIYRLIIDKPVYFSGREPIVLDKGVWCPFNSQNTAFPQELFPLLYLPASVSFRFTDILRGLVAQPILWSMGYRLGFGPATVIQKRNPHNFLKDFEQEVPVYLNVEKAAKIAEENVSKNKSLKDNLIRVYKFLSKEGIVAPWEIPLLTSWLQDLKRARERRLVL